MGSHRSIVLWACTIAALVLAAPAAATTFSYVVVGNGFGLDFGYACLSSTVSGQCEAQQDFALGSTYPVTGTVVYDDVANTVDLNLTLATASMTGSHDGVTEVLFSNVNYVAQVPVSLLFGTLFGSSATASITGSYSQLNGVSTVVGPDPLDPSAGVSGLQCTDLSNIASIGTCGFFIGSGARDFNLDIGTTGTGASHDFVQGFNFQVVVPEPASASLLALGLAGFGLARRRR